MRYCLCVGLWLFVCSSPAFAQQQSQPKWIPWFELGGSLGNEYSRGEATLWAPLWQSERALLFTDIRGKLFDDDSSEGNFSVGFRQMLPNGWNAGLWAGFDYRRSVFDNQFGQVAFGLELLSSSFDFRLNGYVPTEQDQLVASTQSQSITGTTLAPTVQLQGNQLVLVQGGFSTTTTTTFEIRELALWGFEGEVGAHIPLNLKQVKSELRAYVGGFYFDHENLDDVIAGPRLRLEWRLDDIVPAWPASRLTLESKYQWDQVRDDQIEVGMRLRLPFSGPNRTTLTPLTAQERRMSDRLERDTDIVTQATIQTQTRAQIAGTPETTEAVEDALTGADFDRAVVASNGVDLQNVVTSAGSNSLIIAQGGATAFGRTTLSDNQTLMGGGETIQVRGQTSGTLAAFTAPGTRPLISHTLFTEPVVTAANNTHISGVDITGGGIGSFSFPADNSGVLVPAGTNTVFITNANISRPHVHGVFVLSNATNINVIDSFVSSDDGNGITGHDNISINVLRTTIGGISGGAFAFNSNTTATLNEVIFEGTRGAGAVAFLGAAQSQVSGADNINNAVSIGLPICRGENGGFAGSIGFANGDVWMDDVAPCN